MRPIAITKGSDEPVSVSSGPFRVSTARFRPGLHIPSHYHERACVSVLFEGRFEQRFPGRAHDCPPGVILAKPPFERHEDRWFGAWSRHLMIEIDPDRHGELGPSRVVAEEIHCVADAGFGLMTHGLWRELRTLDSVTPLAVEGLVLQLLASVRRATDRPVGGDWPAWLLTAREYVHDNFRARIRLADVARAAGVHPDSVSRLFPAAFSMPVGAYVRRLRVEAAADLLATTDTPISRIAHRVGFADQSHLTRVFKRAMGVPPGRFRALQRGR